MKVIYLLFVRTRGEPFLKAGFVVLRNMEQTATTAATVAQN